MPLASGSCREALRLATGLMGSNAPQHSPPQFNRGGSFAVLVLKKPLSGVVQVWLLLEFFILTLPIDPPAVISGSS